MFCMRCRRKTHKTETKIAFIETDTYAMQAKKNRKTEPKLSIFSTIKLIEIYFFFETDTYAMQAKNPQNRNKISIFC